MCSLFCELLDSLIMVVRLVSLHCESNYSSKVHLLGLGNKSVN